MRDKPLYFLDRRWYTTGNNGFRREKKTMAIQLLKKNSAVDGDMDDIIEPLIYADQQEQLRALGQEYGVVIADADPATVTALTPEDGGLSVRSSVAVLEGLLAPLLSQWAGSGAALRLSGRPNALGLTPVQGAERLTSSTSLVSTSSR